MSAGATRLSEFVSLLGFERRRSRPPAPYLPKIENDTMTLFCTVRSMFSLPLYLYVAMHSVLYLHDLCFLYICLPRKARGVLVTPLSDRSVPTCGTAARLSCPRAPLPQLPRCPVYAPLPSCQTCQTARVPRCRRSLAALTSQLLSCLHSLCVYLFIPIDCP